MNFCISLFLTIYIGFSTHFVSLSNADVLITEEIENAENFIEILPPKTTLPRCGHTFRLDNGGLYYKPFESVLPNERCTWVLGVPGARSYFINIQYLGYPTNQPDSGQELVITGARRVSSTPPVLTSYRPTSTGTFSVTSANIAIIAFFSCDINISNNTGFALQYQAIYDPDGITGETSEYSMHYVFESPTFDFKYPQIFEYYSSNELSAFLFPPKQNIYSSGSTHVLYRNGDLVEDNCYDSLYVYGLDVCPAAAGSGIWKANGRICGNVTDQQIENDDTTLLLFSTYNNNVGRGFSLSFTAC